MGADLYIQSLPDKTRRGGFEVSEEAVKSGYFRDCYNSWGLFAIMSSTLGETISWWQISDRKEWFKRNDDGLFMTPEGCKAFFKWIKPKLEKFIKSPTLYRDEYRGTWDDGPTKVKIGKKKDIQDVKNHAELFLKFYRYACELGSSVRWSV